MPTAGPVSAAVLFLLCLLTRHGGDAILCSQCDSSKIGEACMKNPPAPTRCGGSLAMMFDYCMTFRKFDNKGVLLNFARGCSPILSGETCVPGKDRKTDKFVTVCYMTCEEDGCNDKPYTTEIIPLGP